MNLLKHIQTQSKIMIRYLDITTGVVLFYIILGIILADLSRSNSINIPLLSVAFSVSTVGLLFGRLFCENHNEIMGYMHTPWSLQSVILSKNIVLFLLSAVVPLPVLAAVSIFAPISAQDFIDVVLYFITSISVCLLLGNIISISKKVLSSEQPGTSPLQWIIILASPIPYLIFNNWMQSWLSCLLFFCISCLVFYFYQISWTERNFKTIIFKIGQI